MTASVPATVESAAATPSARRWLRDHRRTLVVIALVAITVVLLAWAQRGGSRGFLDPDAYDDSGSRAVAALLADRGVQVERVTTTADAVAELQAAPGSTLFVVIPDLLQEQQINDLADAAPADIVLMTPSDSPALAELAPGISTGGSVQDEVREPECAWEPASLAGSIDTGGVTYRTSSATSIGCYPTGQGFGVIYAPSSESVPWSTTVIGDARPFQNKDLAAHGNAAFAINALSANDTVVWYLPSYAELAAGQESFLGLAPRWVPFVAIQAFIVVLLLAAWRVRRFGPVLVEPLPTRVPAAETIEGRGRLYRRTRSRDRAAEELRAGTLARLRRPCGFAPSTSANEVVQVVADRVGRPTTEVQDMLFGGVPHDDAALIALATALKDLERNVQ
jgi:hypothetical protein